MKTAMSMTASEYVEAHLPILNAYSRSRRFRPAGFDPDEFRSDLVAQVLVAHNTFRMINDETVKVCKHCGRRGCSTWLGWRARKVGSNYLRSVKREQRADSYRVDMEARPGWSEDGTTPGHWTDQFPSDNDTPGKMQAQAQLQQLLERATPEQAEALISKLEEWSGDDVWLRLGIGIGGRNYRLKKLVESVMNDT